MKALIILLCLASCASGRRVELKNINTEFDQLWNYSDPLMTRSKFQEHLAVHSRRDEDYILQLKTQMARTYSLRSEFVEAHELLNEVENKLGKDTPIANVRYLLERGRTYNSAGQKEKAKNFFAKAYEASSLLGADPYTIDAIHMIAIVEKNFDDKLRWTEKGIEIAQASKDEKTRLWVGIFFNNLGWDLFEAKRYREALEKFEKCRMFYKSTGHKKRENIARWSVAKTYRFLGQVDESLKIQESLLLENKGEDKSGYTYEELAELYLLKGATRKAKDFFSKAYNILSKDDWLQKNELSRLDRLKKLSLQ